MLSTFMNQSPRSASRYRVNIWTRDTLEHLATVELLASYPAAMNYVFLDDRIVAREITTMRQRIRVLQIDREGQVSELIPANMRGYTAASLHRHKLPAMQEDDDCLLLKTKKLSIEGRSGLKISMDRLLSDGSVVQLWAKEFPQLPDFCDWRYLGLPLTIFASLNRDDTNKIDLACIDLRAREIVWTAVVIVNDPNELISLSLLTTKWWQL